MTPHPSRPYEGFLKFRIDVSLLNEDVQGGRSDLPNGINSNNPRKYQMEIEKCIERVIKGSK